MAHTKSSRAKPTVKQCNIDDKPLVFGTFASPPKKTRPTDVNGDSDNESGHSLSCGKNIRRMVMMRDDDSPLRLVRDVAPGGHRNVVTDGQRRDATKENTMTQEPSQFHPFQSNALTRVIEKWRKTYVDRVPRHHSDDDVTFRNPKKRNPRS